jgi:hypothetical protein
MLTLARAFSRHLFLIAWAPWEGTILKEVLVTAKAAAANKAAISSAAPTASTARLVVLFVFTMVPFFTSCSDLSFDLIRRSPLL